MKGCLKRNNKKNILSRGGWIVVLLMLLSVHNGWTQNLGDEVEIQSSIDTTEIKIGEQFHFILSAITDADGASFGWANVPDTFNHLMVVKRSGIDTVKGENQIVYQQKYTLTGFDSGRWEIPAFQFYPRDEKDSAALDDYNSNPLSISVHSVKVDTTQPFKTIKHIREIPFRILDYWLYLVIGIIVLLVILYFVFFYKRKERAEKRKVEVPPEPPYEQAVKNLKQLQKKKLWENGEIKEYYSELTDILRLYIHRRYKINALEQTSDELLNAIKQVTRLNQQRDDLKYILEMADLAKFAKLAPLPEEHKNCMEKASSLVEWTKPVPKTEEDKNKEKKDKNN